MYDCVTVCDDDFVDVMLISVDVFVISLCVDVLMC
jgi:hypothetical protein